MPQPIPTEAVEKLLAKADVEMRAYLLCGWLAGLRLAEAWALEWQENDKAPWVDFHRQRIILPAEFVKAPRDQWVPLDAQLAAALGELPRIGRRVFRSIGKTPHATGDRISILAKQAGVRLTMKSLRKGFGCRYAAKVSAHVLQKLMRHANTGETRESPL